MSLKDNATWKAVKPFLNGGLSGMGATCIIQPLDIVKVRAMTFFRLRGDGKVATIGRDTGRPSVARLLARLPTMHPRDASGIATKRDRSSFERCVRLSDLLRARSRPRPSRPIAGRPFAHPSGMYYDRSPVSPTRVRARRSKTKQVRLQLGATGGPFSVASNIIKNEGFGTLYTGISAGLLRQATYTTARLGIHAKIVDSSRNRTRARLCLWSRKPARGSPRAASAPCSAPPRIYRLSACKPTARSPRRSAATTPASCTR